MSQVLNKYKKNDKAKQEAVAASPPAATSPQPPSPPAPPAPPSPPVAAVVEESKPPESDHKTGATKFEKNDKEQIEIVSENGMVLPTPIQAQAGAEIDLDSDNQNEISSEHKLEEAINNQAKSIADQQLKAQAEAQSKGTLKISSAAAALNNAELGIENNNMSEEQQKTVMSISSDQLYVSDNDKTSKEEQQPNNTEAAAITMAKQAAKNFVKEHPETQKFVTSNVTILTNKTTSKKPQVKKEEKRAGQAQSI